MHRSILFASGAGAFAAVVFLTACAPDAFTDDAGPSDGAIESSVDGNIDSADGGTCRGVFSAPTLVLTVTTDERNAFVTLTPPNSTTEQRKVYALKRASTSDVFTIDTSQPVALTNVGPTPGAFDVGLSADALTLYFSHEQTPDGGALDVDIYQAQRAAVGAPFTTTSKFGPGVNDPTTNQFHARPAGPNLYFTVAQIVNGAQGARDLYMAPLNGGARAPIAELNGSTTQEADPVPSSDELEIFFSSNRADTDAGQNLVYGARRTSAALTFAPPVIVPLPVGNPTFDVTPQYLSPDGCRLYVLVNREDVFVSRRGAL